jgi:alkanesulfonate monooxygenase SsuD/methylene tetrahydromethanopterin reductase-like flavin-dependent oxidoreductase (luciferase family)
VRIALGPLPLADLAPAELRRLALAAVSAGYDAVWVRESRGAGFGGGLAAASFIAQLVPLRAGALVEAGLYHPLHLAEDIAVADVASGGRIEVALTHGSLAAARRYGARPSGSRFAEEVAIVSEALSGAHFSHQGRHFRVPANLEANGPTPTRLAINPGPAQARVPLWLAARVPRASTLARRHHHGLLLDWEDRRRAVDRGRVPLALACPAGVDAADLLAIAVGGVRYFLVDARTSDEATAAARRLVAPLRMPDLPDWVLAD